MSDVQTLMRNANPVPDAATEFGQDDLEALLLLTRSRSTEMDAKELTRAGEKDPRNRRSGWYAAAAAFALVILVIGSVVVLNRGSDPEIPPATTPPTTQAVTPTTEPTPSTTEASATLSNEEIATIDALVAAANSGDWDAWLALHDPGFQVKGFPGPADTTSPLDAWLAKYQRGYSGGSEIALDCRPSDGGQVLCSESIDGPLATAIWFRPLANTIRYQIAGGVIVGATWQCNTCLFSDTYYAQVDALKAWVESVDPEAAALLGDNTTMGDAAAWGEWAAAWLEAGRP